MTHADILEPRAPAATREPDHPLEDPLPIVRSAVRAALLTSKGYLELEPAQRRLLAQAMVRVLHTSATLLREAVESDAAAHEAMEGRRTDAPLARAQAAAPFTPAAARQIAGTTRAILNAVSFPRFVMELISGVFKALLDSSIQQMQAYTDLLNNVAASTEGFADANIGPDRARQWLAERYPSSFEVLPEEGEDVDEATGEARPSRFAVRLREGAAMPSEAALRTDLGLRADESVPSGDPERVLVPFARRHLAKARQEMLATMVMLGMQRIVVDGGRITAGMRFHIDTRDAANADQGSTFDFRNQLNVAGSYGTGLWGVSGSMSNTIGYVSTQRTQTTTEMNTDLELNSSVEINFHSDYLPLERMARPETVAQVRGNTLSPTTEIARAEEEARKAREARRTAATAGEKERREATTRAITPKETATPKAGEPGTVESVAKLRQDAAVREKNEPQEKTAGSTTTTTPVPAAAPVKTGT